jgi:hypothetical protein
MNVQLPPHATTQPFECVALVGLSSPATALRSFWT